MQIALEKEKISKIVSKDKRDYFYLDRKLENWLKLINE